MATSNAFSTDNTYIKYKITVTEGTASIENNTSPVTVTVNFYRTNTGYETYGTGTLYCKINGITYTASVTSSQKITSSGINLFSRTITIPHNADGTKSLYVSAWISHTQVTSDEQGFTTTLATIPRATIPVISPSTVDMGGTITVTLNRASTAFTHKLYYRFGSLTNQTSGISNSTNATTSATFVPPLTLAIQIPDATSGTGILTCETYNGTTLIGTKTFSFVLSVPSSVVPTVSAVTITEAVTSPDIETKFSNFVQGKSKAQVVTTAAGAYGSTILTYKVTVRDANASGTPLLATYSGADVTTDLMAWNTTSIRIGVSVTDSRGRSASVAYDKTLLAYSAPQITGFTAYRSDATGNPDYEGTKVKVSLNFSITSLNSTNDKYYEVVYKVKGAATWAGTLASGNIYSRNDSLISGDVFSADSQYEIWLRLWDFFTSAADGVYAIAEIPTGFTLFDCRSTGKGIAFGKVSEVDKMEIALDVVLTGTLEQEARQIPTMLNSWVNYGSAYESATYWKDQCGVVHLAGLIKSGTTTADTVLFTLPEGYRPRVAEKFFAVSLNAICVIDVYTTGNITIRAGANAGWLSLSGISFRAA